jgi:putative intracellular protease/amidase
MPTEPLPVSLFEIVQRAVDVCDPDGANDGAIDLLRRFEDADEPVTAIGDVEQLLAEATGVVDPQAEDPVVQMVAATATYLAFRRDQVDADPDTLLRLAARAEYDGRPPEPMASWLDEVGVTL